MGLIDNIRKTKTMIVDRDQCAIRTQLQFFEAICLLCMKTKRDDF